MAIGASFTYLIAQITGVGIIMGRFLGLDFNVGAFVGLLALPGYQTSYDTRPYMPASAPANIGYAAAERHFSRSRLEPELLMVQTDHDMRNPADMLVLDRVAKAVFHVPGIAQVQSITRPLGTPLDHSSLAFQISAQSANQIENLTYQRDRANDLLRQAGELSNTIDMRSPSFTTLSLLRMRMFCGRRV